MIHQNSIRREIEAQLTISKSRGIDDEKISISVEDKLSGNLIVDLKLTLEQFANAVTGTTIKVENGVAYVNDNIGKAQQVERVLVPMLEDTWGHDHWERFKDNCKAYCQSKFPGWVMDPVGDRNSHRVKRTKGGDDTYEVIVRRWV